MINNLASKDSQLNNLYWTKPKYWLICLQNNNVANIKLQIGKKIEEKTMNQKEKSRIIHKTKAKRRLKAKIDIIQTNQQKEKVLGNKEIIPAKYNATCMIVSNKNINKTREEAEKMIKI